MPDYTVSVKNIDPVKVSYVRGIIPTVDDIPEQMGAMFEKAANYARQHNAMGTICIAEYYDEDWTGKDIDVAEAVELTKEIPAGDGVEVRDLAGGTVAFTTHIGPYRFLSNAHDAVHQWVNANGYRVKGAGREVYLSGEADGDQADCVTEVQYFVSKA